MTGAVTEADGLATAADGTPVAVPSGQALSLQDVIWEDDSGDGSLLRARFVAPQIARGQGGLDEETVQVDMQFLCESFVLTRLPKNRVPAHVIISLSDRALPFGEADPEATQLFESYAIDKGACIWEFY
ncbi:DUF6497 family protein [Pseudorhodobacter sp.]|uniref:DUF6497 family protein n=1 Tax=Pseudorhodobacter sp. TaxID=1934400 RepID=UPI00264722DD|nr:DUF6497 family protein [Pseudorhodobacter sp.]MDN5786042.1 DUF6497 family protein [Pseudorhodobacter sp.]